MKSFPYRRIPFLVMLLCLPILASADIPPTYCMKARIQLKDGSIKVGYLTISGDGISIVRDGKGAYYHHPDQIMRLRSSNDSKGLRIAETDYHFHRHIQSFFYDTLRLFPQVELINLSRDPKNDSTFVPALLGKPDLIIPSTINEFTVEIVFFCTWGFIETKLLRSDAQWLRNDIKDKLDAGGYELCNYQAILFETPNEKAKTLIKQLQEISAKAAAAPYANELLEKTLVKLNSVIEELRKEKVIIIASCSC